MAAEVGQVEAYRRLARTIDDGEVAAAGAAARALLEPATAALNAALDALEAHA